MHSRQDSTRQRSPLRQHATPVQAARQQTWPRAGSHHQLLATLTPREREVFNLLTLRYTDREIADALFISYRTATTHVARIRDKLGLSSRREVSRLAMSGNAQSRNT